MRRLLLASLVIVFLVPWLSAQAESEQFGLYAVDLSVTNDFPLGPYSAVSAWNLGANVCASFRLPMVPGLRPWIELDNNWWLASPAWVSYGTQINALVGIGYSLELAKFPDLGTLEIGLNLGYGVMFHVASATTSGTTAQLFSFFDQVLGVNIPCVLNIKDTQLGILLEPRYRISPENNNIKHQIGVLLGVRLLVSGAQNK